MFDAGQSRPVQTGVITETQATASPPATPQAVRQAADVSALSQTDTINATPQQRAHLEHEVRFHDDQPATEPEPSTGTPPTTDPATGDTTAPAPGLDELAAAIQGVGQDVMAMVTEALNACKDQNHQAALDMIDAAIASHRKMLEASERHHREQAPIVAARRQSQALQQLQAQVAQEQAAQQAAAQRR